MSIFKDSPHLVFSVSNVSSDQTNLSLRNHLDKFRSVNEGTIIIRFRNYPKQGFMPLLSVSNNQYPSSYLSVYIEHAQKIGVLKRVISKDKIATNHLDIHKTTVVDPKFINTVALSCKKNHGYTLYFNGEKACFLPDNDASLFADIDSQGEIDKAILGDFYESQKTPDKHYSFVGHYDFVNIYGTALTDKHLQQITMQTFHQDLSKSPVFKSCYSLYYPGLNDSSNFRIPTLIKTSKGTLLSSVDQREFGHQDHSNKVKTIVRRSTDKGRTFDAPQTACKMFGNGQTIDSALVEDCVNGRVLLLNNSHPDCLRPFTPKAGTGFISVDGQDYYLLIGGSDTYYGSMDGKVFTNTLSSTDYSFDKDFNLYKDEIKLGNLFDSDCPIKAYQTTYTLICYSDDDGITWPKPKILNLMLKKDFMKSLNVSPGAGLQIKNGPHKNRLCFPVYYYNKSGGASSAIIYSDDFGETFTLGQSPNDGRVFDGRILSSETISQDKDFLTECQIAEMPNGHLKLFMRNMNGYIAIATSKDGGQTFEDDVMLDKSLPDPYCQCSVTSLHTKVDGKDAIAFCNPSDLARTSGTVKIGLLNYNQQSDDYDITWQYSKLFKPGSFAYSCLAQTDENSLGVVFEGTPSTVLSFAEIHIDSIKTADDKTVVIYQSVCKDNTVTIKFDEAVLLTGNQSIVINTDSDRINASLTSRSISDNTYIFTADKNIDCKNFKVQLCDNTQMYDLLGERAEL